MSSVIRRLSPALVLIAGLCASPCRADGASEETPTIRTPHQYVYMVYLNPADRECRSGYQERLDRVVTEVQTWYRDEMQRNGFGPMTFPLERDKDGKLIVHVVKGSRSYAKGEVITYSEMRDVQVKPALLKEGIDIDHEHIMLFINSVFASGDDPEEEVIIKSSSHYCGGGESSYGTAWIYDYDLVDPLNLPKKTPRILDDGVRPLTLGMYVVTYMGGVAHEFGHALGLPHNAQTDAEFETLGWALMGSGNHHFLAERAGEEKGAFLSKAHATILSSHPLFNREIKDIDVKPQVEWSDLKITPGDGEYVVTGRVQATPPAYAVVAYHDPEAKRSDYDATSWTAQAGKDGRFEIRVGQLTPGDYELRLRCFLTNNAKREVTYRIAIDAAGKVVCRDFDRQTLYELHARPAIEGDDDKALAAAVEKLAGEDDYYYRRAKAFHRIRTQPEPERKPLNDVAEDVREVALSAVQWTSAKVGEDKPMCDRFGDVPLESGCDVHDTGLFAYADSRYAYRLDGKWKRLISSCGLQSNNAGSVVFVVKCDGQERFRSSEVKDYEEQHVDIDLAGVDVLELIVEGGDDHWADGAAWFSPKLTR